MSPSEAGPSLMIPGALERRVGQVTRLSTMPPRVWTRSMLPPPDRARLEYGREGGGSLRERTGGRWSTIFGRIWRRTRLRNTSRRR